MPKGHAIGAAEKADIYEAVKGGVPVKDVASDFGISEQTVRNIYRKYKLAEEHEEERAAMDKTLAGDKYNGLLRCIGRDLYEGTCRLPDGKFKTKTFRTTGSRAAQAQWERWCENVREENGPEPFAKVSLEPAPIPEITVTRRVEEPEEPVEEPVEEHVEEPEEPRVERQETAYVIYLMTSTPKFVGQTASFERAMQICEDRNAALEFAGFDPLYEVAEIPWLD